MIGDLTLNIWGISKLFIDYQIIFEMYSETSLTWPHNNFCSSKKYKTRGLIILGAFVTIHFSVFSLNPKKFTNLQDLIKYSSTIKTWTLKSREKRCRTNISSNVMKTKVKRPSQAASQYPLEKANYQYR